MSDPITEADLQAFIDGRVDEPRRSEIEAYLAANPAEAERLAAYREQNLALHRLFDPVLHEPIPHAMSRRPNVRLVTYVYRVAAMLAVAVMGGVIGWSLRPAEIVIAPEAKFAEQAAVAYVTYSPEVRHPVEVAADEEAHLVNWLSKRLGAEVRPPQLASLGYGLMGGRLLPGENGPAAQFMYQDEHGRRLTLYVAVGISHDTQTAFRYANEKGVSVFYWIDGSLAYALSGELDKHELLQVAQVAYQALNR